MEYDLEKALASLDALRIELPSWGFADTGTRFGKFCQPGAAITCLLAPVFDHETWNALKLARIGCDDHEVLAAGNRSEHTVAVSDHLTTLFKVRSNFAVVLGRLFIKR